MVSFQRKIKITLKSSLLFFLLNLKQTYELTNKIFPFQTLHNGCVTNLGLLSHTIVFLLLTLLSMTGSNIPLSVKLNHSILGSLIFFFLSSKQIYSIVNKILRLYNGCQNIVNVLIHTLVYGFILLLIMNNT
jgi:ABC-type multidrug transport system fused ATPase/permease subunit